MKTPEPATRFETLIIEAARTLAHKRKLEADRKWTAHAFLTKALETAGLTPATLQALQQRLKASEQPNAAIHAFVRRCALELRSPNWIEPPVDCAKVARIYGADTLAAELHDFNVTTPQLVALGVAQCVELYPDTFGVVASPTVHAMRIDESRTHLINTYEKMRSSWTGADVEIDPKIPVSLRDQGFTRLRFRRHKHVFLIAESPWPEQLAQAELDALAHKAEPEPAIVEGFEDDPQAASEDAPRPIRRRVPSSLQAS
jgi:hypothetical protein